MRGKIDFSKLNTPPEKHELDTARFFSDRGHDVIFINPSSIPKTHTPDILMDSVEWEMKSPQGKGKRTIEQNMRHAVAQSRNIIFDLRRTSLSQEECLTKLKREFDARRYIKRLYVIMKNNDLVKYTR